MVQIVSASAIITTGGITSSNVSSEVNLKVSVRDVQQGERVSFVYEGLPSISGIVRDDATNNRIATVTSVVLKKSYDYATSASSTEIGATRQRINIVFEKNVVDAQFTLRSSGIVNVTQANRSYNLLTSIKRLDTNQVVASRNVSIPRAPVNAYIDGITHISISGSFYEGARQYLNLDVYVSSSVSIPRGTRVEVNLREIGLPFRFNDSLLYPGYSLPSQGSFVIYDNTPTTQAGVYRVFASSASPNLASVSSEKVAFTLQENIPGGLGLVVTIPYLIADDEKQFYDTAVTGRFTSYNSGDNGALVRTPTGQRMTQPTLQVGEVIHKASASGTAEWKVTPQPTPNPNPDPPVQPDVVTEWEGTDGKVLKEKVTSKQQEPPGTFEGYTFKHTVATPLGFKHVFEKNPDTTDPGGSDPSTPGTGGDPGSGGDPQDPGSSNPTEPPEKLLVTEWLRPDGKALKPAYTGKEIQPPGNFNGYVFRETRQTAIGVQHIFDVKQITPPPPDPTDPGSSTTPPEVTTTVHTIKNGNNVPEWGNGDCVWCNCEDAFEVTTTITTTTTKRAIKEAHQINFQPTIIDEIKQKGTFNLIYIMDGTGSRSEMVKASLPSLRKWAESVKNSGINYYFEAYGHDLGPTLDPLNKFKIPGNFTGIYQGTKGDRLGKDKRFGQLIDYMESQFPNMPILFVYEGDYQDYDRPQGRTLSFFNAETLATLKARKISFLGINDHARNRVMESVGDSIYEVSTGVETDIVARDFILTEFAKEVVVQPASTGKTTISISDPSQGVNITSVYVTEPDGNNRVLQVTSGKYIGDFNPTQQGNHILNFVFEGMPSKPGIVYATLNGTTTQFPYKSAVSVEEKVETKRSSCEALKEMNTKKLRDFAILYRDLETCNLAEEGAKGFYNVWCMFNNVIDQLCYLQDRIDGDAE